jgi:uncharacterized membrane protein YebE (DUF533 family)
MITGTAPGRASVDESDAKELAVDLDLDVESMIGSVLKGTLLGRRKRTRGVQRLLGKQGGLLNASSLLALAGLAWGVYETATKQTTADATAPAATPSRSGGPPAGPPGASPATIAGPPPIPGSSSPTPDIAGHGTRTSVAAPSPAIPDGVLRVIRLTLSAARADGTLTDTERDSILAQAKQAGAEAIVQRELDTPVPLADIVAGVADPAQRNDLYTLAFAIVRADETVSGGERLYLAQLAYLLGLGPDETSRLEEQAARRIDEAKNEGEQRT